MLIVELSLLSPLKHLALAAFSGTDINIALILGMMTLPCAADCDRNVVQLPDIGTGMVLVGVVGVVNGGAARRCGRQCGHGHGVLVNVGGGVLVVGGGRCKY